MNLEEYNQRTQSFALRAAVPIRNPQSAIRNRRFRGSRGNSGMTLIEVLIASAILVFGMVGILALFNAAARTHKRAVDETTATQVAMSVMSELRGDFAHSRVPPSTDKSVPAESNDYPGYKYHVRIVDPEPKRTVKDTALMGKEYYVEVKVLWSDRGEDKSVLFQTVMFLRSP